MNVKEAVTAAKTYLADLYAEESARNLGLEEVEFNSASDEWIVTIGFSRPWDDPRGALAMLANPPPLPRRTYKVVRIANISGEVRSIKNRETEA